MALFDIRGDGRALPVATTPPDDADVVAAARAVLDEHLSTVLAEPMLIVAQTPRSRADLLALDASGRLVVVQVAARLTAPVLLEALDVAGQAARLTLEDLESHHPRCPDHLHASLREFFATVPPARHETPGAVRLVIVCAKVDPALLPAVAFLRSGPGRVELLRLGLVPGRDGQRLVDVTPLVDSAAAEAPAAAPASEADPVDAAALVAAHALVSPVDLGDADQAYVPVFLDLPPDLPPLPLRPSDLTSSPDQAVSPVLDLLAPAREPGAVVGPVDARLAELAGELAEPLALVWLRHRRGERFEVVLHPDGSLHTDTGERYADPTWAASAVSGGTASDGWRVWRAGDHGRTLAELRA